MNPDQYVNKRIRELEPSFDKIKDKLLSIGGIRVNINYNPLHEELLKQGRIYTNKIIDCKMNGTCLENTWELHNRKDYSIHLGYALGKDFQWYAHAWPIDDRDYIIETVYVKETVKYFGMELTEFELLELLIRTGLLHAKA